MEFAFQALQIRQHLARRPVSTGPVLFQRPADDSLRLFRQIGIQLDRRGGRTVQNSIVDHGGCGARERHLPGGHFVQHRAEAEEVCTGIEFLAPRLLR
jgi:hypothetical protein